MSMPRGDGAPDGGQAYRGKSGGSRQTALTPATVPGAEATSGKRGSGSEAAGPWQIVVPGTGECLAIPHLAVCGVTKLLGR